MTSKEQYIAQSLLGEAERGFREAREDVRSAARIYESFRATNPTSRGTIKARNTWNLNVILWISTAVALEEALERVLILEHASDPTAPVQDKPAIDLSTVDPSSRVAEGKVPPRSAHAQRTKRDEDLEAAAEKVKQTRVAADRAYAVYRRSRLTAISEGTLWSA